MADAFGAMLAAHLAGAPSPGRTERDDGWVDDQSDGAQVYFAGPTAWPAAVREALERITPADGPVLDVGAGAGRHARWLQDRGVDVVAIDSSPGAVAVMRARGLSDVRLLGMDDLAGAHDLAASFGAVLLLGNNLGLLGTVAGAPARLAALATVTRPDAVVLAETLDPRDTRDPVHLGYQDRNRRAGRPPGHLRLRSRFGHELVGDWFDYLLLSGDDARALVADSPWAVRDVTTSPGTPSLLVTLVRRDV